MPRFEFSGLITIKMLKQLMVFICLEFVYSTLNIFAIAFIGTMVREKKSSAEIQGWGESYDAAGIPIGSGDNKIIRVYLDPSLYWEQFLVFLEHSHCFFSTIFIRESVLC